MHYHFSLKLAGSNRDFTFRRSLNKFFLIAPVPNQYLEGLLFQPIGDRISLAILKRYLSVEHNIDCCVFGFNVFNNSIWKVFSADECEGDYASYGFEVFVQDKEQALVNNTLEEYAKTLSICGAGNTWESRPMDFIVMEPKMGLLDAKRDPWVAPVLPGERIPMVPDHYRLSARFYSPWAN